jgi:hypothetical protein
VVGDFHAAVRRINAMLEPLNARLMPTGAHPWMNPDRDTHLWPHGNDAVYRAYDRIFGCQGHGWSNLQSMHINLPFKDDAEFGRLHAAIRVLLPILPALAASTPFLDGRNTGFADARIDVYAGNQRHVPQITGRVIPEPVRSEAQYSQVILEPMFRAIAPHDTDNILQFEWLNSRGAIARFDRHTIEIRVLDAQEHPGADLAIAQLVVATVKRLYRGADALLDAADALDTDELAAILRQCVKHGEAARLDNTEYLRVLGVPGVQDGGRGLAHARDDVTRKARVAPRSARRDSQRRHVVDPAAAVGRPDRERRVAALHVSTIVRLPRGGADVSCRRLTSAFSSPANTAVIEYRPAMQKPSPLTARCSIPTAVGTPARWRSRGNSRRRWMHR